MERKWTKETLKKEIEEMDGYIPVRIIERNLGMPPTTLQKVLKGQRELPKKWIKKLEDYFIRKPEVEKTKNTNTHKDTKEVKLKSEPPEGLTGMALQLWKNRQEFLKK